MNTELKTLKDLKIFPGEHHTEANFSEDDLKAEAIKWIKEIRKEVLVEYPCTICDNGDILLGKDVEYSYELGNKAGKISFIARFFNITEDDLND